MKETRGGARPGAGRKPMSPEEKKVQMVVTIEQETKSKIKEICKKEKIRPGKLIDEIFQDI